MPRKSAALKEAVAVSDVPEAPKKRGPKPKEAQVKTVDMKAVKKEHAALVKKANSTEKEFRKEVAALQNQTGKDRTALYVPVVAMEKEIATLQKALDKQITAKEKLEGRVINQVEKLEKAAFAKVQKLAAAKEKEDVKLAKEIASLEKVLGSATE